MMSAGFQWGQAPLKSENLQNLHNHTQHNYTPKPVIKKRRFNEEDDQEQNQHNQVFNKFTHTPAIPRKRVRTEKILGQQLPVTRLIEVLDHKNLQNLVLQLLKVHPEIESTITSIERPSLHDSVKLLQEKFNEITNNLPYKYDIESDYSYLRVKPYIIEFLNCTSDFILNFVPPIEDNIFNSLNFLTYITEILQKLPKFTSSEFSYILSTAYEQIANTWLLCLTIKEENNNIESLTNLIKIVETMDLVSKLNQFNQNSEGKFQHVLQYLQSQLDQLEGMNSVGGVLGDLILVDYSNYSLAARTSH